MTCRVRNYKLSTKLLNVETPIMTEKMCKMQIMMPELHLTIDLSVSNGRSGGP